MTSQLVGSPRRQQQRQQRRDLRWTDEAYDYPEGGLSLGNKVRGGDTINDLTGVMHRSFPGSPTLHRPLNFFVGELAYSYVFDGQIGYLDYALANDPLLGQVTSTAAWHINADEVPEFDYNDDIKDPGEPSFERETIVGPLYKPDPFRSSDHDPVLVGLRLDSIPDNPTCNGLAATIIGTPGDNVIIGTDKNDVIVTFGGNDTIDAGNGDDVMCAGYGDDWSTVATVRT